MKYVLFKREDGYYFTNEKNYNSYVWNASQIHKLNGVNTREDAVNYIRADCVRYNDKEENYIIID